MPKKLKGFDPLTGKELWVCNGLGNLVYTSPLVADGIAVNMSGFHGPALAVKLGGTGDITKDRLWLHDKKNPQRIGSGVRVGEHVYMMEENGVPHCFEVKTGKEIWNASDRPGDGAWGSMVHADGKLYVPAATARRSSSPPAPSIELLATQPARRAHRRLDRDLPRRDLFIRTHKHLWCIGKTP